MGLIGNYSVILKSCGSYIAGATISDNRANFNKPGSNKNYFYGAFDQRSSIPNGYNIPNAWVLPMKTGWVSIRLEGINALNNANLAGGLNADSSITGSGDIINADLSALAFLISSLSQTSGLNSDISGLVNIASDLAGDGNLEGSLGALIGIVASLNGDGDLSGSIAGAIQAVADLTGDGDLTGAIKATVDLLATMNGENTLTSEIIGNWDMIVSLIGTNALTSSIRAFAEISSNPQGENTFIINNGAVVGSMSSTITSLSELSPESLASSVWSALASQYNQSGTMGEKLNGAGSAGNPWTEIIEGTYTAAEVMRMLVAVAAGKTTITDNGNNTATVVFRDLTDTEDRVTATMEGSERINITLNP
jgi:hypothetical protein